MSFSNLDEPDLPGLPTKARSDLGVELQATLIELLDLALVGKQMHWNTIGPNFIAVHRLLDEFIEFWYDQSDTVAERAVQLGYSVDGQASAVAKRGNSLTAAPMEDEDVVRETTSRIKAEADILRARIAQSGSQDVITQNLLIGILEELEKQLWFIRVQLNVDSDSEDPGTDSPTDEPSTDSPPPRRSSEPTKPTKWSLDPPRRRLSRY